MNVYEVEIQTDRKDFRLVQHVRAVDELQANGKVQAMQGKDAVVLPGATLRRACTEKETAEELAKAAIVPVEDVIP